MVEEAEAAEDYSLASKDLLDARLILIQVFVSVYCCLLLNTICVSRQVLDYVFGDFFLFLALVHSDHCLPKTKK